MIPWNNTITFSLNGRKVTLTNPSPQMKLITYLRDVALLTGTKLSCGEGGCGACTVVLCHQPLESLPQSKNDIVFRSVNSCLFPVCALDGVEVFTVEGIGSTGRGLHAIQKRLADGNGTQCGFCTPGWVMNMYEYVRRHGQNGEIITKRTIEDQFDGNLCRCTGYRPIFQAFHSFATESEENSSSLTLSYDEGMINSNHDRVHVEPSNGCHGKEGSQCKGTCGKASKCSRLLEVEDLLPPPLDHSVESPYDPATEIPPSDFIHQFKPKPIRVEDMSTNERWYRPLTRDHLKTIVAENDWNDLMFVGGRTAYGINKYYNGTAPYNQSTTTTVQVEVNYLAELKAIRINEARGFVEIGAAVTLTTVLQFLESYTNDNFDTTLYKELASLWKRVANHQVRNSATWAGNVSTCRDHPTFVSDVVVGLMGIGATLTLWDENINEMEPVQVDVYLAKPRSEFAMIANLRLPLMPNPPFGTRHILKCYKVAQRMQNSHSHVNCAIFVRVHSDQSSSVCTDVRIVYGGVTSHPARFPGTEMSLKGSVLTSDSIQLAINCLEKDLEAIGASEAFGSTVFRLSTMKSLLYKTLLACVVADTVKPVLKSGSTCLTRNVSTATQSFKEHTTTGPVGQAITKLGAKIQASGEAQYVADKELPSSALHGAILFSRVALGQLISIDPNKQVAMMDGVIDVLTANDIPGSNDISSGTQEEPLFVPINGVVRCVGAPIGIVLATTAEIAEKAAAVCDVVYGAVPSDQLWKGQKEGEPIVSIDQAIAAGTLGQDEPLSMGDEEVESKLKQCKNTLTGSLMLGAQKHFYMEPQASVATPQEDGVMLVETSSQDPTYLQAQVADVLGVKHHALNVKVQRVGGGFGGKLTRCIVNAAAAAVAARKFRRAVRVVNNRSADFRMIGGREPMRGSYSVGFDQDGCIQALDMRLDVDCGYTVGDSAGCADMAIQWSDGAYRSSSFRCRAFLYLTNTQTCTWLRAPGVPQSLFLLEAVIHHIAETLDLPMRLVQLRNLYRDGDMTPYNQVLSSVRFHEVWDRLLVASRIEEREQANATTNVNNKWKKRGVAVTPTKYGIMHSGLKHGSRIEVFAADGSVLISHGGCEIGQGIHTKAVQVCAYALGIPMTSIIVCPTSTDQVPNSDCTGGSSTSESIVRSLLACCQAIKDLMKPIDDANPTKTWQERVQLAHGSGIRLFASAQPFNSLAPNTMFDYFVYAAACSEVEVDILTGEINLLSVEIVYDCGISLNPAIDIGQIEGAFVMGTGLYLEEEVVYSPSDADLQTEGTWEYKIPCSKDIPEHFKVTLLENPMNPEGILNSKATGEPPFALATSVYFAVKNALKDSRVERGINGFYHLDVPATVARRQEAARIKICDYIL